MEVYINIAVRLIGSISQSIKLKTLFTIMANTPSMPGIKNSWSLLAFAKAHGHMQVGKFTNKETGEEFESCIFTNDSNDRVFVAFSSKMGTLTPREIAAQKDRLQVVELESGNYSLCRVGENSWEDVDLF